jgi:carboxypeptidase PM20D1
MKKIFLVCGALITLMILILIINTLLFKSKQNFLPTKNISINSAYAKNLSEAIQIKTISYDDPKKLDSASFHKMIRFIKSRYPLSDSLLEQTIINKYSVLYKWKGKNENLKPVLFLAHTDVVPADTNWEHDPFSGDIKDGFIWGRGSLDDKVGVLGILEATEKLLNEKFTPERTIYFAFGHDEEVMGKNGASAIASYLKQKNLSFEYILDEGLMVTDKIVPGIDEPVALIGIAEKGYLTIKLSVKLHGGHGSMPLKENCISVLSSALIKIQEHPFKPEITEPVNQFLESIGPEMPFFKKIIFANRWLFKSLIKSAYQKTESGNALLTTTISPTIFQSGSKDNVIPAEAFATLNIRSLPGHSHEEIIEELKKIFKDERIKIEVLHSLPPSPISSTQSSGFLQIQKTIREIFPHTFVAPSLMIAGTDSKHYASLSPNIYRFLPIRLKQNELKRIHGANEKISEKDYLQAIRFYYQLIHNSTK